MLLSFPGKMILTNKILKYCSCGLVKVASWKPKEIELSLYPPMLFFNSLMLLLKYVPFAGQITPDTVQLLTLRNHHGTFHRIHSKQSFIERMQMKTALTFSADT